MLTYQEALAAILDKVQTMPAVSRNIASILGCVLAQPVIATIDSPPFDCSAVDGFGVRLSDVAGATEAKAARLRLVATLAAGDAFNHKLPPSGALKILTGACVPSMVEAVVMKEYCLEKDGYVEVSVPAQPGENIRRRGGEFLRGREILPGAVRVTPPVVALLASLGHREFPVHKMPRAAVVTTGSELTKPGRLLMPGRIYDSNSYAIEAALHGLAVPVALKRHALEDKRKTVDAFRDALEGADIIISTGGVSVGDFDYVKEALESLGVQSHLWKIAIKPGKPVYFGIFASGGKAPKYVFGLPGNPVSALLTFHLIVQPAIFKMIGVDARKQDKFAVQAILTSSLQKKAGRLEFVRGRLLSSEGKLSVEPTSGQESHMLGGLAQADCLIVFPLEAEHLERGQSVSVRPLNWSS